MVTPITGATLIAWGHKPGPWFKQAIAVAEAARQSGQDEDAIRATVDAIAPKRPDPIALRPLGQAKFEMNIRAESPDEVENVHAVERHMRELMRTPTLVAGAVMPDACPTGRVPGTIPVGGIVAAKDAIHPGFHSADICCSMAVTILDRDATPSVILDAGMTLGHFGKGGRAKGQEVPPDPGLLAEFERNPMLRPLVGDAIAHHATSGDGNHFVYVGRLASTEQVAIVTHHGSRKPGAMLYKAGMAIAEKHTRLVSPETPPHNAWIDANSPEGQAYWEALQLIRLWTRSNHFAQHERLLAALGLTARDRFWNEHNFVFHRDGLFYHAKGATPAYKGFSSDESGLTLIPLNMAEPILITRGLDAAHGLGFAPHGAGRNSSRSAFIRALGDRPVADVVAEQTRGIDARFFCGRPDVSELPGAYKSAAQVRAQICEFGLAEVVDTILPMGSIMAGEYDQPPPWRDRRKGRR